MEPLTFSKAQARRIILEAAGLSRPARFGLGIDAVYRLIDHLGFVQLDTNYVVERAHHHVMFARVPDYQIDWISQLCEDGLVYEYFSADAGYLPMADFRYSLPIKEAFKLQGKPLSKAESYLMGQIMDQVERDGPVKVSDFENDRDAASSGWWDWRPAKVALERLYLEGSLMISRDGKFHKRYDVPLNMVPPDQDLSMPSAEEFARFVIRRTLGALGICSVKEIAWRARRVKGNLVKSELANMLQEGMVRPVTVEGVKGPLYLLAGQDLTPQLSGDVFILSPFDILNVFRHRLKEFFGFDYQIECFVPAAKRLYGYFSLPVLYGDTFIARMDAKADRRQKVLMVHNIHFEEIEIPDPAIEKFVQALKDYARFNQCEHVIFGRSNKQTYLEQVRKAFS